MIDILTAIAVALALFGIIGMVLVPHRRPVRAVSRSSGATRWANGSANISGSKSGSK